MKEIVNTKEKISITLTDKNGVIKEHKVIEPISIEEQLQLLLNKIKNIKED